MSALLKVAKRAAERRRMPRQYVVHPLRTDQTTSESEASAAARSDEIKTSLTSHRMNAWQKLILIVVAACLIAMLLYPPFVAHLPGGAIQGLGYSWLFDRPVPEYPYRHLVGTVNFGLLLTQWAGALIVGAIAVVLLRD